MIRIGDLVRINVHGDFHPDVQLDSYWDEERNLHLAKSYIFTSSEQGYELGSVELLWTLCETFIPGSTPNRLVVIANYGHGKSHFAVAAANYFGKPTDSQAFQAILGQLRHVVGDSPLMQRFESFRASRRPFLIILLRGDESPMYLSSKFVRALERALEAHEATKNTRPRWWFSDAEEFLRRAKKERRAEADEFLQQYGLDLEALEGHVRDRSMAAYGPCRELCKFLYGMYPSFGESSLREMVEWIADELTGEGKPFAGALILFDEFSTFVHNYARWDMVGEGAPLQDLLSGVERRRGRVTFVAFAQHDPLTVVEQSGAYESKLTSVQKELDRLDQRFTLKSVLEEVVDSYLSQDEGVWRDLSLQPEFRRQVEEAISLTLGIFKRRYERLRWNADQFRDKVVRGCFPLHPATTALFSSLSYGQPTQPRSVLRFVFEHVRAKGSEPIFRNDGQVNWILPIELIDWFEDMLPDRAREDYRQAIQDVGPDADPILKSVLKAVLLLQVGDVPTKSADPARVIAHFCGLNHGHVKEALEELVRRLVLRHDAADNRYLLWGSRSPIRVEPLIRDKLVKLTLAGRTLEKVVNHLAERGGFSSVTVSIPWGSPQDWQAAHAFVVRSEFSESVIRRLVQGIVAQPGAPISSRGLVIWPLAETPEDVQYYRQNGQQLLDTAVKAVGYPNLPVVLMRPRQPSPDLLNSLKRLAALLDFTRSEIEECGPDAYEVMLRNESGQAMKLLRALEEISDPIIPELLRSLVVPARIPSLGQLMRELFQQAFYRGPREFFTQYHAQSHKMTKAVSTVAHALSKDTLLTVHSTLHLDPVAKDLIDRFLASSGKWKLLTNSYRIQPPPPTSPIIHGWQLLEERIQRGAKGVQLKGILVELLNPPYGYDSQTLTLLFSAWYGYNRRELDLSVNGQLRALEALFEGSRGLLKPQEVIETLSRSTLTRRNLSELESKAREIVERISRRETISQQQAEQDIQTLQSALKNLELDGYQYRNFAAAKERLEKEVVAAREYERRVHELHQLGRTSDDLNELLEGWERLRELSEYNGFVQSSLLPKQHLSTLLLDRIQECTRKSYSQYEQLKALADYDRHADILRALREKLQKRGLDGLANEVGSAIQRLASVRERLEQDERAREHDRAIQVEMAAMSVRPSTDLATLRRYLEKLESMRPQTVAVQEEWQSKRQEISAQITTLQRFIDQLQEQLQQAADVPSVRQVRDCVLQERRLFEDTPEAQAIEEILARAESLEQLFTEVANQRSRPLETPADVDEVCRSLRKLGECDAELSEVQQAAIENAIKHIQEQANKQVQAALNWLTELEGQLSRPEELLKLKDAVDRPPSFLPPDQFPRLAELRRRVEQALEEDAERQVEHYFQRIRDPQRRRALLDRLIQLAEGIAQP